MEWLTSHHLRQADRHVDGLEFYRLAVEDFCVHLYAAFAAFDVFAAEEAVAGIIPFLNENEDDAARFQNRFEFHELCNRLAQRRQKDFDAASRYLLPGDVIE